MLFPTITETITAAVHACVWIISGETTCFKCMKLKHTSILHDLSTGFIDQYFQERLLIHSFAYLLIFCISSFQEGQVKAALPVLVIPRGMTHFEVYFPTDWMTSWTVHPVLGTSFLLLQLPADQVSLQVTYSMSPCFERHCWKYVSSPRKQLGVKLVELQLSSAACVLRLFL